MGTKLNTVVINKDLVTIEDVISAAYEIYKEKAITELTNSKKGIKENRIPCINSVYLEVTNPWDNGMAFLYSSSFDDHILFAIKSDEMACKLSKKINDIPFIYLWYNSVVSTGSCSVFINGKCIKETISVEGDGNKNIDTVFKKYFGMGKNCFNDIDNIYFDNTFYHGQFNVGSYSYLEHVIKNEKNKNSSYYKHKKNELLAVKSLIENPDITEDEWRKICGESCIALPISCYKNTIFKDFIYKDTWHSRAFVLTDGNLFTGAFLLTEAKEILPDEYFSLEEKAEADYENWNDKTYGKKPKSYTLTEEELNTLSYEDQKKEAYKRLEIARNRGDQNWSPDFYAHNIKFPLDIKCGDYIKFKDGRIARVCFTRLTEDMKNKRFVEEIKASLLDKSKRFFTNLFITDMKSFVKISESEVPNDDKIPDNKIKF